jgi:hypothetical protein
MRVSPARGFGSTLALGVPSLDPDCRPAVHPIVAAEPSAGLVPTDEIHGYLSASERIVLVQ